MAGTGLKITSCDLSRRLRGPAWHAYGHAHLAVVNYNRKGPLPGPQMPRPTFKDVGTPESGYALAESHTHRSVSLLPDGTRKEFETTLETEVTELAEHALDPALFEIPPGFRRVRQIRQAPPAPPKP